VSEEWVLFRLCPYSFRLLLWNERGWCLPVGVPTDVFPEHDWQEVERRPVWDRYEWKDLLGELLAKHCPPPEPPDAKDGWIAPNGDFYSCSYSQHTTLAEPLVWRFYPDEGHTYRPDDVLLCHGWLHVSATNVNWNLCLRELTQAQLTALYDLAVSWEKLGTQRGIEMGQELLNQWKGLLEIQEKLSTT
jgi:hypothetical protein